MSWPLEKFDFRARSANPPRMKRLAFIGLFGCAAAILPSVAPIALAQSFPSRPVNLIVPFPPGGNTDIMARALQNEMSKALSQTMVITTSPAPRARSASSS